MCPSTTANVSSHQQMRIFIPLPEPADHEVHSRDIGYIENERLFFGEQVLQYSNRSGVMCGLILQKVRGKETVLWTVSVKRHNCYYE